MQRKIQIKKSILKNLHNDVENINLNCQKYELLIT